MTDMDVPVSGTRIACDDDQGSGPAVVRLHGLTGTDAAPGLGRRSAAFLGVGPGAS